jgi:hypothetical protein
MFCRLIPAAALAAALGSSALAQQQSAAGDRDDQVVISGCVMRAGEAGTSGPRSLLIWSKGDVYIDAAERDVKPAERDRPVGTSGRSEPVFYWIDDEDDFARHAGKRVEIVGELADDIDKGEIEIEHKDPFTEIEFEWEGEDVTAQVPTSWLGPGTPAKDSEFDIAIRRVDVEKVTVLSESCR